MAVWKVVVMLLAAAALIATAVGQGSKAPEQQASTEAHKRMYQRSDKYYDDDDEGSYYYHRKPSHKHSYDEEPEHYEHHYHKRSYDEEAPPEYYEQHHEPCVGTAERPVREITLPSGAVFCLHLPRFLKKPQPDVTGTKQFVRTWNDTCGLYSIVFSKKVPKGAGPPPHVHFAEDEWFLPGTPGDIVRIHAQKKGDKPGYTTYHPGQVPGFNMPPVEVGGVEVPYGRIGYAPVGTPHTFKGATDMTNFMAIWGFGFAMIPAVNIPESMPSDADAPKVLEQTGLWGVPADDTAAMFAQGKSFVETARGPLALPPVSWRDMERLQSLFDRGEKCCTGC